MLEILGLLLLTKWIETVVEGKGYASGRYKLLAVLLWISGEIAGFLVGWMAYGQDVQARCLAYVIALLGAGVGAGVAYVITNNLAPIGPTTQALPDEDSQVLVGMCPECETWMQKGERFCRRCGAVFSL
jgi:hypothetical protein